MIRTQIFEYRSEIPYFKFTRVVVVVVVVVWWWWWWCGGGGVGWRGGGGREERSMDIVGLVGVAIHHTLSYYEPW
jgi:hypothetical protein